MNLHLHTGIAAAASLLMVSCYPYNESNQQNQANKKTEQSAEAQNELKAKEQEAAKKQEELKKQKTEAENAGNEGASNEANNGATTTTTTNTGNRSDYAFANKVPGKEGFVFSPYNNKVVDVRDIPSGTLVQDPTYPAAEKKYFRVP